VYHQNVNPTGTLWLSALPAALPLIALLAVPGAPRPAPLVPDSHKCADT
jgi:hypothetical protein